MTKPEDQQAATTANTTQDPSTSDEEEQGRSSDDASSSAPSGQVILVADDLLATYPGSSIGEKVDNLIQQEKVVMINRSWCLFSIDAMDFLVVQLGVTVHSLEVDHHPQGAAILKYVQQKYNHKT